MALSHAMAGAVLGGLGVLAFQMLPGPTPTPAAGADLDAPLISCHQSYPNIPGKLLLENDKVVVQAFTFPPGQWEGVHAHPPNQLYIHLTDAIWTTRMGTRVSTGPASRGSVAWYGPVTLAQDHESVNAGPDPIELIWVTLKDGCAG